MYFTSPIQGAQMKQAAFNFKQTSIVIRLSATIAFVFCLGLLEVTPASAAYEQVDTFAGTPGVFKAGSESESWPEEVQLGGAGGMAVNYTGAGGVPKGTLYAATSSGGTLWIARFNPDGSFSEAWTFGATLGGAPNERCGPEGDPAHPACKSMPGGGAGNVDVDVDQSTGNVYFLTGAGGLPPGTNLIHVYSPDGSKLIAEFGEQAPGEETFSQSPGKIHSSSLPGGLAVDGNGNVYVWDRGPSFSLRLLEFKPQSPGDYEHYVYAGQSHDIPLGIQGGSFERGPVADAAGDLFIHGDSVVLKLDPSQPTAAPSCEFKFPPGQIVAITVDPLSGEVFFRSFADKKIHVLNPCKEGKFTETGKFAVSPPRTDISALAFDPGRQFAPDRPAGVLYAAAPDSAGGNTEGEPPNVKGESSLGYVFAHPIELPPEVLSESVARVTATTAELGSQINPKGPPTNYTFQYVTQAEYEANGPADRFAGAKESPPGGGLAGEGSEPLSAGASLTGLEPDTVYHYRAVATNHCDESEPTKVCKGVGADQSFRTFPVQAPGLPDRRVYELVTPTEKAGGGVYPADPSMSSICLPGNPCKPGGIGGSFPRQSAPDGEAVVYEGAAFSGEEGAVNENEYVSRRDPKTGWQTVNLTPAQLQSRGGGRGYQAFDTGLSQGVLTQLPGGQAFSPEAPQGYEGLYSQPPAHPLSFTSLLSEAPQNRPPGEAFQTKYAGGSTDLSRIFFSANDALTNETSSAPKAKDGGASKFNLYEWAEGELRLVNVLPGNTETNSGAAFGAASAHAVSDDGSRVFWEDEAHQVYVRENAETTVSIPAVGKFLAASTDGSKVLLSSGALYDLQTKETTDLTEGKGGFQGVVGESKDLSRVYFVDTAVLTEEENEQHAKAQAGKFNLYAWEAGGSARFVATLSERDNNNNESFLSGASDWKVPSARSAEASPQGRYLAFVSLASLTGYDNVSPCLIEKGATPPGAKPRPCPEVFHYDLVTGKLSCASCNLSGLPPLGLSMLRRVFRATPAMPQPHYLTDQGRLFFDSQDSLTPFDTNEGVEDVYQFEPNGVGTCKREAGCLNLISAGTEPIDSNLLAVDESGKNVFFTTHDQLVLKDTDDLVDLYDAREDGGIASETEVSRAECQGEACVPALSPPNDPTPSSSTFEGAGNVDEKKAAKKHKKKHVKKKHVKKHAHKRAAKHNRGGSK